MADIKSWLFGGSAQPTDLKKEPPGDVTYIDPLNYDPSNVPDLVGPQMYWSSVASHFMPAVRDPNVIASTAEAGITMSPQPVIDYTPVATTNPAVGNPNVATGAPPGVRMSRVMKALEEKLLPIQDFLAGAP